jgi:[CysO sulfur-carrier protein]-S-L-cysteine hydrolase
VDLTLAPGILDEVIEHARAAYPREACGLIAGPKPASGASGGQGTRFIPMANIAQSAAEFDMDPADLIKVLRDLRNAGEALAAIYHSHPHGPPHLSAEDIRQAYYPEAAHLIVCLSPPERPQIAAFRIVDGEVLEIGVHAIV